MQEPRLPLRKCWELLWNLWDAVVAILLPLLYRSWVAQDTVVPQAQLRTYIASDLPISFKTIPADVSRDPIL